MEPSKESPHYKPRPEEFQPPAPLIPVSESEYRLDRAQILLEFMKEDLWPNRKIYMRGEDLVAMLIVAREDLEDDGPLSADLDSDLQKLTRPAEALEHISHSCIHYMLHLDPDNLEDPRWKHAIPEPREPEMSDEEFEVCDIETFCKAIARRHRFSTVEHLQPVRRSRSTVKAEEAKCLRRDSHMCVATGNPSSSVFWFIPFTWNDTVDHMNATGELRRGALHLAGVRLLGGPNPPCNAHALGGSHKAWNMLCIDKDLCRYLNNGLCAFKWLTNDPAPNNPNDDVKITLQFHWMPLLELRWGQKMNINRRGPRNDFRKLAEDIKDFNQGPQVNHKYGTVTDRHGMPLRSGQLIHITMPKQDAEQCRDAVKVHWTCVVYAALCGAAGRSWLLADGAKDESRIDW